MGVQRIAFLVFPGLTVLDFVGGYDALRRLATMGIDSGVTHRIIGTESEVAEYSWAAPHDLVAAVESAPFAFSPWLADQIREPVLREALG